MDPVDLPRIKNPQSSFFATANEMNLPPEWLDRRAKWLESSRANRIGERLAADNRHSLGASCSIQTDLVSIPARRLLRTRFDVTGLPD
jgi:penicillin G amidase